MGLCGPSRVPGVPRSQAGVAGQLPPGRGVTPPSPLQRTSWSPMKTPHPSFCRARASRWIWRPTAWTTASTSTSSTSATSCGARGASPAPAAGPRGRSVSRYRGGCRSGAPEAAEAWGAPLSSQHIGLPGAEFFPPPQGPQHTSPEGHPEDQSRPLASRDPGRGAREAGLERTPPSAGDPQAQGPLGRPPGRVSRGGAQAGDPHGGPSCLLTPPGTPLSLEPAVPDWPEASSACGEVLLEGRRNGPSGLGCAAPQGEPRARPAPQSWPCWLLGNCLGVLPLRGPGVASGPGCQSCPRTPVALDTGQAPEAAGEGTAWLRPGQLGTRGVTLPGGEEGWPRDVC